MLVIVNIFFAPFTKFKVYTTPNLQPNYRSDNYTPPSFSISNQQIYNAKEINNHRHVSGEIPLVYYTDPINKFDIPILLDSGASNHCFADILLFISYTSFDQLSPGSTAEKELIFNIAGKGSIKLQTNINGERRTITFDNILYTSGFRSNLILMAKLSTKGAEAYFKNNKAIIRTKTGIDFISAIMGIKRFDHETKIKARLERQNLQTASQLCPKQVGTGEINQIIESLLKVNVQRITKTY